ncbi:GAF domain-containing protein [Chloroflexota bacterium]
MQIQRQIEETLERRNKELSALNRVAQLMSQSMKLKEILQSALDGVIEVMEIPVGSLYLVDENSGKLSCAAYNGLNRDVVELIRSESTIPSGAGFSSKVMHAGKVMITRNLPELIQQPYRSAFERAKIQAAIGIPLRSKGKILGVLVASSREQREFSPEDILHLETIGNQIGVAIENAQLFEKVSAQSEALESYVALITKAQEEERRRIARDLHDDTVQLLAALSLKVQRIARDTARNSSVSSKEISEHLEQVRTEITDILESLRRFSHKLRPEVLDQLGLIPAIELLTEELANKGEIKAWMEKIGTQQRLSTETEVTLFRIAQEAMRNIKKHSQATEVAVRIEFGTNTIKLQITDNGKGFELPEILSSFAIAGRLGLIGMYERTRLLNGDFTVSSQVDKGTTIAVEVPY